MRKSPSSATPKPVAYIYGSTFSKRSLADRIRHHWSRDIVSIVNELLGYLGTWLAQNMVKNGLFPQLCAILFQEEA